MMNGRFVRALPAITLLAWTVAALSQTGDCPQQRSTYKAPDEVYTLANPHRPTPEGVAVGRRLYEKDANPACEMCHGIKGDGKGALAAQFDPRPRNFACAQTVNGIPDGQLFWIIKFGSPGTSMPAHASLTDDQMWKLVAFLRRLARP